MKQFFLVFPLLFILTGCSTKTSIDETQIVGTWRVVAFDANVNNITPEIVKTAEANALSSVYIFFENKTYQMIANYRPNGLNGNWTFTPESKILEMTDETDETKSEDYIIVSINKVKMKWKQDLGKLGNIEMTLQRMI